VAQDGGVRFALGDVPLRALAAAEIKQLEALGNTADDWSRVRVVDGFDPRRVQHCSFHGDIALGRFAGQTRLTADLELPTGVYRSTIANGVVGHESLVRNVGTLVNFVLGRGALVSDCGSVACDGETSFGNGQEISIAIETGGRELPIYAEIDVEVASIVARARSHPERLKAFAAAVAEYTRRATSQRAIIDQQAVVRLTPTVRNAYIGPHAAIDGATLIADSTILSSADEPVHVASGACVTRSLVQWGSHVTTMALVDSSVLTEHSHVERHGKVTASVVGPNSGVAEGEVTACLLGPFVGFHHQALLIAALWPEGKGNVGYGANVGSNHTSKAPDQEFWPGEGAFLGLGVNIKYPADLSRAPYTIIASGVTTLPQKVTFPFSLINHPSSAFPHLSPAYNEIIPAWLLTDNMFTLKRNEGKYKARNKATRTNFEFDVFRPAIVDLMASACRRLRAVAGVKEVYTDRDVEGLGKNFMLESSRRSAIDAYKFYMKYYALLGLLAEAREHQQRGSIGAWPQHLASANDELASHPLRVLRAELGVTDALSALRDLPKMLEKVACDVEQSKAKDDERGARVIDDYADVHTPASKDKFVRQTWEETRRTQREVQELIDKLQLSP
jgi:hypothetical protein